MNGPTMSRFFGRNARSIQRRYGGPSARLHSSSAAAIPTSPVSAALKRLGSLRPIAVSTTHQIARTIVSRTHTPTSCFNLKKGDNGVARVTIKHQPINLLDEVMAADFDTLTRELEDDDGIKVVILQSALPEFFIAHSGLGRLTEASKKSLSATRSFRQTQVLGERIRNMPKITISKVAGICRGGGNEIALAADMCFAAIGKAIFAQPEVGLGLVPGGGSTQRLPRLIGRARALEVLLSCQDFSAEDAERMGFINRALPPDQLDAHVERLAEAIAGLPAHAVVQIKKAVDTGALSSMSEGLLCEAQCADISAASDVTRQRVRQGLEMGLETVQGEFELPAIIHKLSC